MTHVLNACFVQLHISAREGANSQTLIKNTKATLSKLALFFLIIGSPPVILLRRNVHMLLMLLARHPPKSQSCNRETSPPTRWAVTYLSQLNSNALPPLKLHLVLI